MITFANSLHNYDGTTIFWLWPALGIVAFAALVWAVCRNPIIKHDGDKDGIPNHWLFWIVFAIMTAFMVMAAWNLPQ